MPPERRSRRSKCRDWCPPAPREADLVLLASSLAVRCDGSVPHTARGAGWPQSPQASAPAENHPRRRRVAALLWPPVRCAPRAAVAHARADQAWAAAASVRAGARPSRTSNQGGCAPRPPAPLRPVMFGPSARPMATETCRGRAHAHCPAPGGRRASHTYIRSLACRGHTEQKAELTSFWRRASSWTGPSPPAVPWLRPSGRSASSHGSLVTWLS